MRKTLLTATALLLTVAQASMAQGLKLGPRYEKQRMEMAKRNAEGKDRQSTAKKTPAVDQWTNVNENIRLRYVFGYDTDMQRASETIYVSTRDDNDSEWGEERLLTVGSYKYEYDTQGRVKKKTVTYSSHEGVWINGSPYIHFDTYYIEVSYGSDGLTTYDRYELENGEGEYRHTMQWQNNADGTKVTETTFDYDGDIEERTTYTPEGHIAAQEYAYYIRERQGTLNDSTITKTRKDGDTFDNEGCHYRYDANTGRLLEYANMKYGEWDERHLFTYDAQGRIVKYERQGYSSGDDEEAGTPIVGDNVLMRAAETGEGEWTTTYTETYTYANDEVYPMSSPWRAVFGMEGPLTAHVTVEEDVVPDGMGNYGPQKNTVTFSRDADGKLTAVTYDIPVDSEWDGTDGTEQTYTATVDANGHIVGTDYYYHSHWNYPVDNGTAYSDGKEKRTTQYTWNGESVTRSDTDEESHTEYYSPSESYEPYSYYRKSRTDYAYTATSYTATTYVGGSDKSIADCVIDESEPGTVISEELDGTAWKLSIQKGWDRANAIRKIQDRDLSFRRPSIINSYDGFAPDSVIVASVKGRVAVARYNNIYRDFDGYKYGMPEYDEGVSAIESFAYANLCDNWLDVNDEDGLTVCRDVEGQPVYILDGTRLLKEYIYHDIAYAWTPVDPDYDVYGARRAAADVEVQPYDELTYTYNYAGLLTSITTVSVSQEGERTQEVTTEYIYNASTAIDGTQQATHRTLALKGRTLSTDEGTLSVFNAAGQLVATGAATITLPSAGLYIVKWAGGVRKITVR